MPPHKSEDYKISAVQYYLSKNINQKYKPKNKEKLSIKSAF